MRALAVDGGRVLLAELSAGDQLGAGRRIHRIHHGVGWYEARRRERRRHPFRCEHGDERLADAQGRERLTDVVVGGDREGLHGLPQVLGIIGREGAERVLHPVAELRQNGVTSPLMSEMKTGTPAAES